MKVVHRSIEKGFGGSISLIPVSFSQSLEWCQKVFVIFTDLLLDFFCMLFQILDRSNFRYTLNYSFSVLSSKFWTVFMIQCQICIAWDLRVMTIVKRSEKEINCFSFCFVFRIINIFLVLFDLKVIYFHFSVNLVTLFIMVKWILICYENIFIGYLLCILFSTFGPLDLRNLCLILIKSSRQFMTFKMFVLFQLGRDGRHVARLQPDISRWFH